MGMNSFVAIALVATTLHKQTANTLMPIVEYFCKFKGTALQRNVKKPDALWFVSC
jgi:hypothetical protein